MVSALELTSVKKEEVRLGLILPKLSCALAACMMHSKGNRNISRDKIGSFSSGNNVAFKKDAGG